MKKLTQGDGLNPAAVADCMRFAAGLNDIPAPRPRLARPETPEDIAAYGYALHVGQPEDSDLYGKFWWTLLTQENRSDVVVDMDEHDTAAQAASCARIHLMGGV
jgi:hypothetical protein